MKNTIYVVYLLRLRSNIKSATLTINVVIIISPITLITRFISYLLILNHSVLNNLLLTRSDI